MHAGHERWGRVEQQEQVDHRLLRRGHAEDRRGETGDAGAGDERAGARGLSRGAVAAVGEKRHVVGTRAFERRDTPNDAPGVPLEGGAQRLRELAEGELGSIDHRGYFFFPPASRS